ncbi:MAG: ATP-binding protein [Pararhodobacter sp.]
MLSYSIAMLGRLLKPFLPRGLYWRAALIVFLPVVTILLVVSLALIQRHYDGVTRQMTGNFVLVARHILSEVSGAATADEAALRAQALAETFELGVTLPSALPATDVNGPVPFYDLSGRLALRELDRGLSGIAAYKLVEGDVSLWLNAGERLVRLDFPLSRISARNPHQILVLTGVIGIVMSLISFIYLKNQMRPIRRLAQAADAFGRGQVVPFRPAGATEVRAAGKAFLEMRERIERHIEQRTLLLSGVSHDLRTPLTRMRLALSMLEDEPEAQALLSDVAQMEALIDRFLEFARTEAVEPVVTTDLGALIEQRVAEAARGGRDVGFTKPAQPVMAELRPQQIARALDNLIGNALRYGTAVRVTLSTEPGAVVISVEDNGPGIDPREYERAMRPFERLDPARGASTGSGTGLGLAIVRDAARSHGGWLTLDRGRTEGLGGLVARMVLPTRPQG